MWVKLYWHIMESVQDIDNVFYIVFCFLFFLFFLFRCTRAQWVEDKAKNVISNKKTKTKIKHAIHQIHSQNVFIILVSTQRAHVCVRKIVLIAVATVHHYLNIELVMNGTISVQTNKRKQKSHPWLLVVR